MDRPETTEIRMFQPGSLDRPHPMSRRRFLGCAGAIATGGVSLPVVARVLAPDTSAKRKILFLGGTEYLGPATVSSALRAGHEVTLFNRGRTNPHLFPDLEKLRGDRYPDRGEGLAALGGTRQWDAVIDTWQGPPVLVDQTAELLTGRVGSYTYVSSVAVYGGENYRKAGIDEEARLPTLRPMPRDPAADLDYPRCKQYGETVVRLRYPDAHHVHRAHAIIGTLPNGDVSDLSQAYWPARVDRGGEILAPGAPTDTTQWIDVEDLATWIIDCIDSRRRGTYNVLRTQTMNEFLLGMKAITGTASTFTWVPARELFDQGVGSWGDVPLWISHQEPESGFCQISDRKTRDAGLRVRPMADTFGRVLRAFRAHHSWDDFIAETCDCCRLARVERRLLELHG